MKRLLVFLVVLSLVAVAAQAAPFPVGTMKTTQVGSLSVVVEYTGATSDPNGGALSKYNVYLKTAVGTLPVGALDLTFAGRCGQVGYYNSNASLRVLTPDLLIANGLTKIARDSHFMLNPGAQMIDNPDDPEGDQIPDPSYVNPWSDGQVTPAETNSWTYGPKTAGTECFGYGTLGVTCFITTPARANNLLLAQIVYQDSQFGTANEPKLTGSCGNDNFLFDFSAQPGGGILIEVPEPATLALVVMGGLGLISRKRR